MAVKTPIVLTNGQLEQLQVGDTLAGGGGGSNSLTDTITFDFGNESDFVIETILSALITNANILSFSVLNIGTTETSLDDFTLNGINFTIENIVDSTSFDIRANSINNASGIYTIKYLVTYV